MIMMHLDKHSIIYNYNMIIISIYVAKPSTILLAYCIPPFFLKYITIIIKLTKQSYNTYSICCEKSNNAVIKPSLNRRIVEIEVRI